MMHGVAVPRNIAFLAACNPYRLKKDATMTAGLDIQQKKAPDKMSKLVYRVYPLPETMLDYLWDFGSLSPQDEELYIKSVFSKVQSIDFPIEFVDILSGSVVVAHEYIRQHEDVSAVSMRDVRRCEKLVSWFLKNIANPDLSSFWSKFSRVEASSAITVILSIAHCYRSRLPHTSLRENFDKLICDVFSKHHLQLDIISFQSVIRNEQVYYLDQMDLKPGIAKNETLLENIFVLLVCILLKMPIFLVGKPGSSKTLAVKILESNLRGRDSVNPFFQRHNRLKLVTYQGSTSSTSEPILQAFDTAKSYARETLEWTVVVLIDEVGLAEISSHEPLKVLHHQLEVSDFESESNVGLVGISNWPLDDAKMNRAIHISRPDPDIEQLNTTSHEIVKSICPHHPTTLSKTLRSLSETYYNTKQSGSSPPNFHSLRDFYSCVKQIGLAEAAGNHLEAAILQAVSRNFNGLKKCMEFPFATSLTPHSVKDYVCMNLKDKGSRHLLLITRGDTILNMIDSIFKECKLESPRIIIGSKLKGDQCENYHYWMLSVIIECMDLGTHLVLKDLDAIYGSLYDMLNQAYSVMAGKQHCRVALGAYSNPMCHVHENFKCVVIVDQSNVVTLDPPFLSRFEKQRFNFLSFLNPTSIKLEEQLRKWVSHICDIPGRRSSFTGQYRKEQDLFISFGENTLESLIASLPSDCPITDSLKLCQQKLLRIASTDGIIRILNSKLAHLDDSLAQQQVAQALADPSRCNMSVFLSTLSHFGSKDIVTTFTPLHFFSVEKDVPEIRDKTIHQMLESFDTEISLVNAIRSFYLSPSHSILIFGCHARYNRNIMLLAKFIVDREASEWKKNDRDGVQKNIIFLVHVNRTLESEDTMWEICFSAGWNFTQIDNLFLPIDLWNKVQEMRSKSILDVLDSNDIFIELVRMEFLPCFSDLHYRVPVDQSVGETQVSRVQRIYDTIKDDSFGLIKSKIQNDVIEIIKSENGSHVHWMVNVALDRELLELCSFSLIDAVPAYLRKLIHVPLLKLLYMLELHSATEIFASAASEPLFKYLFLSDVILDSKVIPVPRGNGSYEIDQIVGGLSFPFSIYIIRDFDDLHYSFLAEFSSITVVEESGILKNNHFDEEIDRVRRKYSYSLKHRFEKLYRKLFIPSLDYRDVFFTDHRLQHDFVQSFLNLSTTHQILDPKIRDAFRIISLFISGTLTIFLGDSPPTLVEVILLVWEFHSIITSLLTTFDFIRSLDSNLDVLEFIQPLILQYVQANGNPKIRNVMIFVSYQVACFVCEHCIMKFCSTGINHNTIQSILHTISLIQTLTDRSSIPMDDGMLDIDPNVQLLHSFYLLHVLRELSSYNAEECERRICLYLHRNENGFFHMSDTLFQLIIEWLVPSIKIAGDILCLLMNWFLYVSACSDPNNSLVSKSIFILIIHCLYSLRDSPPISASKPLENIMIAVFEIIQSHYQEEGSECEIIISQSFAGPIFDVLMEFNTFCARIRGTKLEILILDLIFENFLFGPLQGDNYDQRCETFFESASNIIVNAPDNSIFLLFIAHSVMKNFLSSSAIDLTNCTISPGSVAILNQIFTNNLADLNSPIISTLRYFFIKCLGTDLGRTINSSIDGGRYRDLCPWLASFPWPNTLPLVAINPGELNPYFREYDKVQTLGEIFTSILDEIHEFLAISRISGLMWSYFRRICAPKQQEIRSLPIWKRFLFPSVQKISHFINLTCRRFSCLSDFIPPNGDPHFMPIMSCLLGIVTGSVSHPHNLLARYFHDLNLASSHFVVGADSDSIYELWKVFRCDQVKRYKCKCDSCFWLLTASDHPIHCNCGRTQLEFVGFPNVDTNPLGFTFSLTKLQDETAIVRSLPPIHYRVLCVLVHGTIISNLLSALTLDNALAVDKKSFLSWIGLSFSWKFLCDSLGSQDLLLVAFHHFLKEFYENDKLKIVTTTEDDRLSWENEFSLICAKYFDKISKFQDKIPVFRSQPLSLIERNLEDSTQELSLFYRPTHKVNSFNRMVDAYYFDVNNITKFPLVHVVFCHRHNLQLVSHLRALVIWTNQLRRHKNLCYSRDETQSLTHEQFLQEEDFPFDTSFKNAQIAWNEVWKEFGGTNETDQPLIYYGRTELLMFQMTPNTPISLSCLSERGDGFLMCVVLHYLASIQNSFLDQVHSLLVTSAHDQGTSLIQHAHSISLQEANSKHLISFDESTIWEKVKSYGRRNLEYGLGHHFEFDFGSVEKVFYQHLVQNTAILTRFIVEEMVPMRFKNEIFSHYNRMDTFVQLVPQERIANLENVKQDHSVRDINEVSNTLIPSLEALFYIITESREQVDGSMLMLEYVNLWSKDVNSKRLEKYQTSRVISQLQLKHLGHFYEILEDKTSEIVIKHIEVCYAQPITQEFRNSSVLADTISFVEGNGRLLHSTFRRFIVRYLRKPSSIGPKTKLVDCYQLQRFTPWKIILSNTGVSMRAQWNGITVGQSITVLKELEIRVIADEEAKRALERLNSPTFHQTPSLINEVHNPAVANPLRRIRRGFRA
jgi:hypothetical protein